MFISSDSDRDQRRTSHIDDSEGLPTFGGGPFDGTDGGEDPDVATAEGFLEEAEASEMKSKPVRR